MANGRAGTVELSAMETLRMVIERLIAAQHLEPNDEHTLENALIDAETSEYDHTAPKGLPSDAEDLGEWTSGAGIDYHFFWVQIDEEGSYIIAIGTKGGDTFVNNIYEWPEQFRTSNYPRIKNYS